MKKNFYLKITLIFLLILLIVAVISFLLTLSKEPFTLPDDDHQGWQPNVLPNLDAGLVKPKGSTVNLLISKAKKDASQETSFDEGVSAITHVKAPAVIPREIEQESDPLRRERLLKMHKLASARSHLSILRHRQNLLTNSITRAKRDGSWTQQKIEDEEKNLEELIKGIEKAEEKKKEAAHELYPQAK